MGLFKPAWQSDNKEKALKAVEKENDQQKLADIALNAPSRDVSRAAISKISSQSLLADLARNTWNTSVCLPALGRLTDQAILADFAQSGTGDIRLAAVEMLQDQVLAQKVYADIVNDETSGSVRLQIAGMLSDQTLAQRVYADVAKRGENKGVRINALNKLTDQELIADLVKGDSFNDVYKAAIAKLTDQAVIIRLVKNGDGGIEAVKRIADPQIAQEAFIKLAKNGKYLSDRMEAVKNLSVDNLAKILKDDSAGSEIRGWVLEHPRNASALIPALTNQELLAEIACCAWDRVTGSGASAAMQAARNAAIAKITDQSLLKKVVLNHKGIASQAACDSAAAKITDLTILEEIAASKVNLNEDILKKLPEDALRRIVQGDGLNRSKAAVALGDQKLIWELRAESGLSEMGTIGSYITDQNILFDIVMKNKIAMLRSDMEEVVFAKLTSEALLTQIVKDSDNREARELAFSKLGEPRELLADMAKKGHISAIEKLTDKALLTEIATGATKCHIRIAAAKTLKDQAMLLNIAKDLSNNHHDRISAINSLSDKTHAQKVLSKMISNDSSWHARAAAIYSSTDRELLTEIANGGSSYVHTYQSEGFDDNIGHTTYTHTLDLRETAKTRLRSL